MPRIWLLPQVLILALAGVLSLEAMVPSAPRIRLRNGTFDPLAPGHDPALFGLTAVPAGTEQLQLLQVAGPIQPEWRLELEGLGVRLLRYVPDHAFVVRLGTVHPEQVRSLPYARWLGPFRPNLKLDPRVRSARPRVRVLLAPDLGALDWAELRRGFSGLSRRARLASGDILEGELQPGALLQLLESASVLWVEPAPRMRLFDEMSSKLVGGEDGLTGTATLTQQLGFDGTGVGVAVADSGLQNGDAESMHPDLAGRVTAFFHYGNLEDASDEHSHGTHVAGIIAGDAAVGETDENGYRFGLGVAPGSHLVAQRIFDGIGNYEAPPSFETLTRDAVRAGADIGSNSWGDDTQGRYDLSAAEFDALVRDADALRPGDQPYVLEFSAGNAGPGAQTIGSPAVGKNVIATGASENERFEFFIYANGRDTVADFSSRGPCEDGRIKPDVSAPGTWIASLKSESASDENAWAPISDYYLYMGGTSQSGPHASGAAAVFIQYYRETHGGLTPSPALVKAVLIDSAVDMDDGYTSDAAPNADEGWGRVDLTRVIGTSRRLDLLDQEASLRTGEVFEHRLVVDDDAEPLRITLVYTDVPGFPAAIPALVNDLDLEVEAPDGTRYRGNQFLDGESTPDAASADRINNVEGVRLAEPAPGEYIVRVRAFNVVGDARSDRPGIDQDFALVSSGGFPLPGVGVVFFDRTDYTAPDLARLKLIDPDLVGQTEVVVEVSSTTEPVPEAVRLQAAGVGGVFTNSIMLIAAPPTADGQLSVTHSDALQAAYLDAAPPELRLGSAVVDLVPPVSTDVRATNALGKVLVQWTTDEPAQAIVRYGTNTVLSLAVTNRIAEVAHEVALSGLSPGVTYQYLVVSVDAAGNTSTNDNNGALFSIVARPAPTALLVDAYFDSAFPEFGLIDIPVSSYTDALDDAGVSYDVWSVADRGSPGAADLEPFRAVIWRLNDNPLTDDTISPTEQAALTAYVQGGGGLFLASMEVLTRMGPTPFATNVLQVHSFTVDPPHNVAAALGEPDDAVGDGLSLDLDYTVFDSEILQLIGEDPDVSDVIQPSTNGVAAFTDISSGLVAGLHATLGPTPSAGRVVYLAFPWDAVSTDAPAPNNRAGLLRAALNFLAPGADGLGVVAFDRSAYSLPARGTIEVGDSDLLGTGALGVRVTSDAAPSGIEVALTEIGRSGVFRGSFVLADADGTVRPGELAARAEDTLRVEYLDLPLGKIVSDTARVDTLAPLASAIAVSPDYQSAVVQWETDEFTDALVQFGESPFLERTAYDPVLGDLHEVTLTGLRPDRIYYFQVTSRDAAGNATTTTDGGQLFSFHTLKPVTPPWLDDVELPDTGWTVQDTEGTQMSWQRGVPANGAETEAHSPLHAWGSNLNGDSLDAAESYLISPAIDLSGGNIATLAFWHSYDFLPRSEFDILEVGELVLVFNDASELVVLSDYADISGGWTREEIDLTPYVGQVVYLAWHYFCLSLEGAPRAGWLIDDVSITVSNAVRGALVITNNLSQAQVTVTGPAGFTEAGLSIIRTNLPLGEYTVVFSAVPYHIAPPPQIVSLPDDTPVRVAGLYTFEDANANGMPDPWEIQVFASIDPNRTAETDTDQDSATDYEEYAAGTDPTSPTSVLMVPTPAVLGDDLLFRWASVPGHAYRIEASSDLIQWTPVTDWWRAVTTSSQLLVPAPPPAAAQMYRLAVRP